MFGNLGDIAKVGDIITQSFEKMVSLLTEIRDDVKAIREKLEEKDNGH